MSVEIVCPACNGLGTIIKEVPKIKSSFFMEHPNRKLPFDFWCVECKKYCTKSHTNGYSHKVVPLSESARLRVKQLLLGD